MCGSPETEATQHGGIPMSARIDHPAGIAPSPATGRFQDTCWCPPLGLMRPRVSRTTGLLMKQGIRRLQKDGHLHLGGVRRRFPWSYQKSTDLFHWFRKSPLQNSSFPDPVGRSNKGSLPFTLLIILVWLGLGTRVFADSRKLRSISVIGNFTQIAAKIFQPGPRISAVQHPPDKAQLLGRVIAVASDVVFGELGIQRKEVIHGRRASEQIW
jgi:hypothetical protein